MYEISVEDLRQL